MWGCKSWRRKGIGLQNSHGLMHLLFPSKNESFFQRVLDSNPPSKKCTIMYLPIHHLDIQMFLGDNQIPAMWGRTFHCLEEPSISNDKLVKCYRNGGFPNQLYLLYVFLRIFYFSLIMFDCSAGNAAAVVFIWSNFAGAWWGLFRSVKRKKLDENIGHWKTAMFPRGLYYLYCKGKASESWEPPQIGALECIMPSSAMKEGALCLDESNELQRRNLDIFDYG